MTAGIVMGVMLIPYVSSLSDDIINAVPQSMRDGSYGLGATKSETVKQVVIPPRCRASPAPSCWPRRAAIGETMIVVDGGSCGQDVVQPVRGDDHGDREDRQPAHRGHRLRLARRPWLPSRLRASPCSSSRSLNVLRALHCPQAGSGTIRRPTSSSSPRRPSRNPPARSTRPTRGPGAAPAWKPAASTASRRSLSARWRCWCC